MALRDYWPFNLAATSSTRTVNTMPVPGVAAQEYGVSGTENFGGYIRKEDYNPELDDWQKAVQIYDKMRRTDSMVRAMLQVIKLPLRGAHWQCNAASSDPVDQKIADFCSNAIFDDDAMEDPWDFVLRHILLMLDFGVSVLEKVWMVDSEGNYRFKRLAPRLPKTLREWHINREGKLMALVQYAPVTHYTSRTEQGHQRVPHYGSSVSYRYLTIPADYVAVFCLEREGDNYEGYSLLRNIYRNWWFKDQAYHVMGVGLDRWGVGIPIAQLEEGHGLTEGDKETLRDILQKIRANERAFMVMPEHVQFRIEPSGGGQGTQSHFGIAWLDHNDAQIARNVLAGFLTMGRDPRGTLGFGSRLTDMFISSLNGIAKGIAADVKKQLVRPLCDFNFDMSNREYPEPVCLDLEQVDIAALIETLAKLQGTVLTPQDEDEDVLRKILGLPPMQGSARGKRGAGAAPGGPPGAPAGAAGNGGPPNPVQAAGMAGLPGMGPGNGASEMGAPPGVMPPPPPGPEQQGAKPVQLAAGWEEAEHPRDDSGKFDESTGGGGTDSGDAGGGGDGTFGNGGGGGKKRAKGRSAFPSGSKTASTESFDETPPTPTPSGSSRTASSESYGNAPETPQPTKRTPPASGVAPAKVKEATENFAPPKTQLEPKIKAIAETVFGKMKPDESAALMKGYNEAVGAGYKKDVTDFMIEQAALYQHAPEGDPRSKTYFYGETLDALMSDPDTAFLIQQTVTNQKIADLMGRPTIPKKGGGGGGGGGAEEKAAKEAEAQAKKEKKEAEAAAKKAQKVQKTKAPEPPDPRVIANAHAIVTTMTPEEKTGLGQGYVAAQAGGYTGTVLDYFVQTLATPSAAPPAWLSPGIRTKVQADPVLTALIAQGAKPVQLAASWEETEHPRDDSGKFDESSGGGGSRRESSGRESSGGGSTREPEKPHVDPTRTKEAAKASNTKLDAKDEGKFNKWYAGAAKKLDLDPDPEGQFYDYRGAFKAGVKVPDNPDPDWHWPSDHKQPGHPSEIVGGFSTITGKRVKGTKRATSVEELVKQGWDRKAAEELMKQEEPDD